MVVSGGRRGEWGRQRRVADRHRHAPSLVEDTGRSDACPQLATATRPPLSSFDCYKMSSFDIYTAPPQLKACPLPPILP